MDRDYFDLQKSNAKPFEDEFSDFYRLPKGTTDKYSFGVKPRASKNIDYDSESRFKSSYRNNFDVSGRNNTDVSGRNNFEINPH